MSKAIALPFSFDSNGAVNNTQDPKKVLQDRIVLVVMTYLGERVNRPNFGSNIKAVSFENMAEATQLIKQEVAVVFSKWLPYLNLIDATPKLDPVDNILSISITYNYGINSNPETVSLKTAIISRSGDVITEVSNG
jgi:phage baseplate assembly protein W